MIMVQSLYGPTIRRTNRGIQTVCIADGKREGLGKQMNTRGSWKGQLTTWSTLDTVGHILGRLWETLDFGRL